MLTNRRLLVKLLFGVSICLIASSLFLLISIKIKYEKTEVQEQINVAPTNFDENSEVNQNGDLSEVDLEINEQLESIETEVLDIEPVIGMTVGQLEKILGSPNKKNDVVNAYTYEYTDLTYVIDSQTETIIGYWVYPGQIIPIKVGIDFENGFNQVSEQISWDGPYVNEGRGSNFVLHGYVKIENQAYAIELGADDENGLLNQVLAIYER